MIQQVSRMRSGQDSMYGLNHRTSFTSQTSPKSTGVIRSSRRDGALDPFRRSMAMLASGTSNPDPATWTTTGQNPGTVPPSSGQYCAKTAPNNPMGSKAAMCRHIGQCTAARQRPKMTRLVMSACHASGVQTICAGNASYIVETTTPSMVKPSKVPPENRATQPETPDRTTAESAQEAQN